MIQRYFSSANELKAIFEIMISKELLRSIRDSLPMEVTVRRLGNEAPPSKHFEGYFRFLCPNCGELRATVNPRNNLAHCFCCQRNYNNIDLLIALGYDFKAAAQILAQWLDQHERRPDATRRTGQHQSS